jgi:hypothetical protein
MVVNRLYYGKDEPASSGFAFDVEVLMKALRNIYAKKGKEPTYIEENLFREFCKGLDHAVSEGAAKAGTDPDGDFVNALHHSNEVFSAFKAHRAQRDMAARLLDSNGDLKPFKQWLNEVMPIADHQCRTWFQTEYDTAVIRAHQAADWQQFERERDILPNLKWMPSTSVNPGADHRPFWGTIRPIDDKFWKEHRPGDRWNCKCCLSNTAEPPTPPPNDIPASSQPQPGLTGNPGQDAAVFSDDHPYFPSDCRNCTFYKPGIKARLGHIFRAQVKDCYNCPYVDGCIENIRGDVRRNIQPPAAETYYKVPDKEVYISPYHGADELDENKRIATFLYDKLDTPVYLLPRLNANTSADMTTRNKLLPDGVFDKKSPDFLIWDKLFDAKSMLSVEYDGNRDNAKRKIENRFKSAKQQAENFIVEIHDSFPRDLIHQTTTNYLNMTNTKRIIMIIWRNRLLVYNN